MEATGFTRASHAVWEAMAAGWDERHAFFEQTARPVTARMLESLDPAPGQRLLDLAAGTGVVGFSAAPRVQPGGQVIVSDFAESMVRTAERRAAELGLENVECRVLDAERLDLPDSSVDGVLCRWGLMLMADPAAALRETRRVLRDGGRVSFSVFAGADRNEWAALPMRCLERRGHLAPSSPGTPGILALADPTRLTNLFTAAGFVAPRIQEVAFTWRFAGAADYWEFLLNAAGAIAMVLERLEDRELEQVRADLDERLGGSGGQPLEMPALCLLVSAA